MTDTNPSSKTVNIPSLLLEELENIFRGRSSPKGYNLRRIAGQAKEVIETLITRCSSHETSNELERLRKIVGDIHEATGEDRASDDDTLAERVRRLLADLRDCRDCSQLIEERDRAQDALQETHIALGGDGEWVGRLPPCLAPDSGNLHLDVPELARERMAELTQLKRSVEPKELSIEHRLGDLAFKYIDRLNDQTPEDNAEKIVAEFLAKANPMLTAHFDAQFRAPVETSAPLETPARCIVTEEQAKEPLTFRHWSKDPLIPYRDCHCDTCVGVRKPEKTSERCAMAGCKEPVLPGAAVCFAHNEQVQETSEKATDLPYRTECPVCHAVASARDGKPTISCSEKRCPGFSLKASEPQCNGLCQGTSSDAGTTGWMPDANCPVHGVVATLLR